MRFEKTKIPGVLIIALEPRADERGYFARTYCAREFLERGLCTEWVQTSTSYNHKRGTLRGLHYQAAPHEEIKMVRCTRGAIYDVALDLRAESPTFREWVAVELTEDNQKIFYLPKGIAHGFQTLADASEVFYQMAAFHVPEASRGVRWNDPAFRVHWPITSDIVISPRDGTYPDFNGV
jgi:dTDP-4-dehydrorhamnose 3,5-epimerase